MGGEVRKIRSDLFYDFDVKRWYFPVIYIDLIY